MEDKEQLSSRQRKEIKALDGEKRAALKKIKGVKGKKGKELVSSTEAELGDKLKQLQAKHAEELSQFGTDSGTGNDNNTNMDNDNEGHTTALNVNDNINDTATNETEPTTGTTGIAVATEKERKIAKAQRKRDRAVQKEKERLERIERENEQAGPDARHMELLQLQRDQLDPLNLVVADIPSDGHCLYRAVAAQLNRRTNHHNKNENNSNNTTTTATMTYKHVRNLCADALATHEGELSAFCELEKDDTYHDYIFKVRNCSNWGGHLELRALHLSLGRSIVLYSTSADSPLILPSLNAKKYDDHDHNEEAPIRLSYHLHYYALGEHYNQVLPKQEG